MRASRLTEISATIYIQQMRAARLWCHKKNDATDFSHYITDIRVRTLSDSEISDLVTDFTATEIIEITDFSGTDLSDSEISDLVTEISAAMQ